MAKFVRTRVGTDAGLRRGIQTSEGIGALGGAVASFVTAIVSLVIMVSQAAKGQPIDVGALGGTVAGVVTGGLLLLGYASGRTRLKLAEIQAVQQIIGKLTSDPASEPLDSPTIAAARAAVLRAHADHEAGRITREEYREAVRSYEAVEHVDDERSVVTRGCALARAVRGIALATMLGAVAVYLGGCAYRPPAPVLSGERCMPPEVVAAQAADADALASKLLGWALPLAAAGAAGLPTGAVLGDMDPWERGAALSVPLGTLAVSAGFLAAWAAADQASAQWTSGLGCRLNDDRELWRALVLPDPGPIPSLRGVP